MFKEHFVSFPPVDQQDVTVCYHAVTSLKTCLQQVLRSSEYYTLQVGLTGSNTEQYSE